MFSVLEMKDITFSNVLSLFHVPQKPIEGLSKIMHYLLQVTACWPSRRPLNSLSSSSVTDVLTAKLIWLFSILINVCPGDQGFSYCSSHWSVADPSSTDACTLKYVLCAKFQLCAWLQHACQPCPVWASHVSIGLKATKRSALSHSRPLTGFCFFMAIEFIPRNNSKSELAREAPGQVLISLSTCRCIF